VISVLFLLLNVTPKCIIVLANVVPGVRWIALTGLLPISKYGYLYPLLTSIHQISDFDSPKRFARIAGTILSR
jgi:hypothetical protein